MKIATIPGLLRTKKNTDKRILAFFQAQKKNCQTEATRGLHAALQEFSLRGGKRLRPFLFLLGYRFSGGTENNAVYDVATALEIMHTAALIHDDYIDNDTLRRGKSTFHLHEKTKDAKRTRALEAGNMLMGMGMQLLIESDFPAETKVSVVQKFSNRIFLTAFGEAMDLYHSFSFVPGRAVIEKILRLKTAQYTASGPLTLGSFLAGGSKKEQELLETIGENIGMAFQLADDALGAAGTEATGKNLGSDFREGKPTLLLQEAWKKMSAAEKFQATTLMKHATLRNKDILQLRHLFLSKVGGADINILAQTFAKKAKAMIHQLSAPEDVKQDFLSIAEFATHRTL